MRIDFNQDGSIKKLLVNEFVNQLSSGTTIEVYVLGATSSDYTVRAYGTLPNGENHVLSTNINDGSTWKITLNSSDTAYYGKLAITVQVIMSVSNFTFTYPLYLTINPTIPGSVQFPISLDELNTFLSQLQSYPTKAEVSSTFQRKYDAYNVRFYKDNADYTADISNIADKQGVFLYNQESDSVGFYFKNGNNFAYTLINESIKARQDGEGNVITDTYLEKKISYNTNSFVYAYDSTGQKVYEASQEMRGENVIPLRRAGGQITVAQTPEGGTDAASKYYVDYSISNLSARYLTKNANGDSFTTYAELVAGPWYYGGSQVLRDRNDYAFVQQDETHENKSARYVYQAGEWLFQYTIDTGSSLITDVRVNGVSVVSNTIANIDTSNLVDLGSQQDISGVKNFTNGIKIGNSPITFSNNELQVVNDIVGLEGHNLGSQTKPFNTLYAKYFNDGSGTEATLSDLTNGIIKEINTQYIRIWDLEPGIYKLTYSGDKYLYYYGATNTSMLWAIRGGIQILKIWASSGTAKKWECTSGDPDYLGIVAVGWAYQSSGFATNTYHGSPISMVNGRSTQSLYSSIYAPTDSGTTGQVLISNGSGNAPTWSSNFYTKTEVDNAIQNAIGNVLNGEFLIMASENNLTAVFTDIANAIRDKKGSVNTMKPINMADEILTISSGVSVKDFITTRNASSLFYNCGNLTDEQLASILKYDDTSGATNMSSMFYYCTKLTTIPLIDTSKATYMQYMFQNCSALTTIPLIDTSNATSMQSMFQNCSALTSVLQLNTSKAHNMGYMFQSCGIIEKIDITKLASGNSYNSYFAYNCYSLKTLIIRTMDTIPELNSTAFTNCYHFYGTQNDYYNPDGLKDGAIYVPDDKVASLKTATNWSVFADIIKPLSEYVE